jgi:hypothetical protein
MNCQNCGHQVIEPVISNYCTNCGKPTGISKEYAEHLILSKFEGSSDPFFTIRNLSSAFFPVIASVIPVSLLSYFGGGIRTSIVLTTIDLIVAIAIFLRATTYQFFEDKLRIFRGLYLAEEIEYSKIADNNAMFSSYDISHGSEYKGKIMIKLKGSPEREIEIPSNPRNPDLKTDLLNWLNSKVARYRKLSSEDQE